MQCIAVAELVRIDDTLLLRISTEDLHRLIIVSGRSRSGKSTALRTLGRWLSCVDNIPVGCCMTSWNNMPSSWQRVLKPPNRIDAVVRA